MTNINNQNSSYSKSKDQGPTHFAFIDLGGANVRFGVLKKDDFLARVANNSYGIKNIESCFSLKKGRRVFGTKLGNAPWDICYDFNHTTIGTPTDKQFWKWYAEINEAGTYTLNDEEGNQQYSVSKSHAIAMILIYVKQQMFSKNCPKEEFCEISINATIVVPSFCDQIHRRIVLQAAKIAGFNRVELLNQSTAITMAYRYEFSEKTGNDEMATCENVLVLSVGAQTTEFSIYRFVTGRSPELLATTGTVDFGGASFTARLVDHFLKKSIGLENINAETPERECTRKLLAFSLWKECERAKLDFEGSKQTSVRFILEDKTFEEPITVNEFEKICSAEFARFSQMLADVSSKQNVSSVMFAGGSSRLQWFKRAVEKMKLPHVWQSAITPEEAAIRGAALKSAYSSANQTSNCPASIVQSIVPECLFGSLRIKINDQIMKQILDKELANPASQLPFQDTLFLSNSTIMYLLNGAYVHTFHATRHIFESICCTYDENGLFTISVDNNRQELNNIKDWPGLLSEHDECLAIECERSLKEKQDQQKAEEDAERRRKRAAQIAERKQREEAAKEAKLLERQKEEEERIQKEEAAEHERVRRQKEDEERLKRLQKEKDEERERERERVEHERKIERERPKMQQEDEERIQKDKERGKKIVEAKKISNTTASSHRTFKFSDDNVEVMFKWEESAQRVFIWGTWNREAWSEMQKIADNLFLFSIDLAPGYYQYFFEVDDEMGTLRKVKLNEPYKTVNSGRSMMLVNYIDVKRPDSEFEFIDSLPDETDLVESVLKAEEFQPHYPCANPSLSKDQDKMMEMLINLSPNEKFEFLKSIDCEVKKLIEKFSELQRKFNRGLHYHSSAIAKYRGERNQLLQYIGTGDQYCERLLNVVRRAEALEFLVRVTYYVFKVWQLIKGNEVPKINLFSSQPFNSHYSFSFANQLMINLQLHIRAHSASELMDAFESIRCRTEKEILSKLDKKKSRREIQELEDLARKTVPRNFLSTPVESLKSITDELIVSS